MKANNVNVNKAKEAVKKCPKEVRDYVKALERRVESKQRLLDITILKLKQSKDEREM